MRLPGLVQWYGGKGLLRARIMPLIPRTQVYVEPYGGAASILLNRKISPCEVYNDLNGGLVNLARVIQDARQFRRLRYRLRNTPHSLAEFVRAISLLESPDPIDRAWAFFATYNQSFAGKLKTAGDWGKTFGSAGGIAKATLSFRSRVAALNRLRRRLLSVQIDNRDALEVIRYWDSADTTFYLDPPYLAATRVAGNADKYEHECDDEHYAALVSLLLSLKGCAVLSGYNAELYGQLESAGWSRTDFQTSCRAAVRTRKSKLRGAGSATAAVPRTESVWLNPAAQTWHARVAGAMLPFD